jgi:hypothetical protein
MDRRRFLQTAAASAVFSGAIPTLGEMQKQTTPSPTRNGIVPAGEADITSHTQLVKFTRGGETWTVYEDLSTRDGVITFLSSRGTARILRKTAEQTFADDGPQHLGLDIKDIGLSGPDLLADKLLARGDPEESEVRRAAPPMNSAPRHDPNARLSWNTFVGTRECSDTMPVYPGGNTRTYHPVQYFHEITPEHVDHRHEGLVGGWMPATRKVIPGNGSSYYEVVVFGDVLAHDRFIVQTWHRTAHIENGRIAKVEYGYSYPAYTRRRQEPQPEEFYLALLEFAEYWEQQTQDMAPITLPDASWTDMARYAFVKELMVRPGGVYPKYGAVDRDYYGPEYDGFQDIFTMSFYANMECGRFDLAREIFDNYFTDFVDEKGMVNMRGPETAQYGLMLSLVSRWFNYTDDRTLLLKHRGKIEAIATMLTELHDESLKLPESDPGHGLIHGWCESDACLMPDPSIWWKPYFANSAFAIRGWTDLAGTWRALRLSNSDALASNWLRHASQLHVTLSKSIDANTRHDMTPPYIGPLPGAKLTFRESMEQEHPSEQQWPHRCYAELLHPDVLEDEQANRVIDCMRAYGATTVGVVANVGRFNPHDRAILGFISYGYAAMLLRLGRIEEYILFVYAHRYHDHSRGSWTAGEVSGITGGGVIFCIPAQLTIPTLVRWMLVFEEQNEDRLHLGRALPRAWVGSGKRIAIEEAPTRWGRVSYELKPYGANALAATVSLHGKRALPQELHVAFRMPEGRKIGQATVNGTLLPQENIRQETAILSPNGQSHFEVIVQWN